MWNPRTSATLSATLLSVLLSAALLLSSTVGLVGHDHLADVEGSGYECAIDHERDLGVSHPTEGHDAEIHPAGKEHRHQCVGCHLSSYRSLLAAAKGADLRLTPAPWSAAQPSPALWPSDRWESRSLRGPPIA